MKRFLTFLFIILQVLSFFGCKKTPIPFVKEDLPKGTVSYMPDEKEDEKLETMKPYVKEDGTRFDLPKDTLDRYEKFIIPFNAYPEEFTDCMSLSDHTLLFTASLALQAEFELSVDGMNSSLPLSKLESKVKEYFGQNASLSEGYESKDYFPYTVNSKDEVLIQESSGGLATFLFPYALVKVEEGYDLYMVDLMDPLFFDDIEHQDRLFSGEEIEFSEIEDRVLLMQFRIYHIVEQSNGRLMLKGFRYENKKDITGIIL